MFVSKQGMPTFSRLAVARVFVCVDRHTQECAFEHCSVIDKSVAQLGSQMTWVTLHSLPWLPPEHSLPWLPPEHSLPWLPPEHSLPWLPPEHSLA